MARAQAVPTSPGATASKMLEVERRMTTMLPRRKPPTERSTTRLPRDGCRGGGVIGVTKRGVLEAITQAASSESDPADRPDSGDSRSDVGVPRRQQGRRSSDTNGSTYDLTVRSSGKETHRSNGNISAGSGHSMAAQPRAMDQTERKRMEICSKWKKNEALHQRDLKRAQDKVETGHDMREERFKRLLNEVSGRDNLAYKTAIALREREAHEEQRVRELHDAWEEKVYKPLADQVHERLNPPNRASLQKNAGAKAVDFKMPHEIFKPVVVNIIDDPSKQSAVEREREEGFHRAAEAILGGSRSQPGLRSLPPPLGCVISRSRSRPVLEPHLWGQREIQGTLYGNFAQAAEFGPGFKRTLRGGANVHIHDASDGVLACGSRHSRENGHGDVGILRGDTAARGETYSYKTMQGASSAAPAQDHFTFESGDAVTNLEFPLGKKMFPAFH